MSRLRRTAQVTLDLLDWRTFAVGGAFATVLIVGWGFYQALESASEATKALAAQSAQQQDARRATTRRIDLLNGQIERLQHEAAAGRDQRGQLAAKVDALAAQVEQMGGRPVARLTSSQPEAPSTTRAAPARPPARQNGARPSTSPTRRPAPPRPSPSAVSPQPSPTCRVSSPITGRCLVP